MSTFRGRLFGTGLPGGGVEAVARWRGDGLEVTAGERAWSGATHPATAEAWSGSAARLPLRRTLLEALEEADHAVRVA